MVIQPLLVGFVINLFISGTTWSEILFYCAVVAALGILIAGCSYLAKTRYCQLQIDSAFTIERQLIDKIQHADSSFFSSYDSGHYRQTVNNDANDVSIFILTQCVSFVTNYGLRLRHACDYFIFEPINRSCNSCSVIGEFYYL